MGIMNSELRRIIGALEESINETTIEIETKESELRQLKQTLEGQKDALRRIQN